MAEGLPTPSQESKEAPISDAECIAAMKERNFERCASWYALQEKLVDFDPTPHGRMQLTVKLARLQFESGVIDEDTGVNYAFATLADAREDAFQRYDDKAVAQIDEFLREMRGGE